MLLAAVLRPSTECPVDFTFNLIFFSLANFTTACISSTRVAFNTYTGYPPKSHKVLPAFGLPVTLVPFG